MFMRRIALALLLIMVVAPFFSGCGGSKQLFVRDHYDCHWSTGQLTTCTIQLQNDAKSTGDFDWTATSSTDGVIFTPESGSVSPGATSDPIQVTIPPGVCPFTLTFTDNPTLSFDIHETNCS